uniref:BspA family leucine-rich repeat surface protein n=1 Tax=Lacinutrix himadriensis TaxID=641549 RepID=UPI0006E22D08
IQYLDLSNVGNLYTLNCRNNDLSYLDISNGFNSNIIFYRSDGNPNLQCVSLDSQEVVDDWNYRTDTPTTFQVDVSTTFSIDCSSAFITTWKTDNPGVSNDNSITIPANGSGPYNFTVNWGDDTVSSNITSSITHQYATAGTYTVTITGEYPWFWSGNTGDKDKLLSVDQWGDQIWYSMDSSFYGCSNVVINASDTPDLSQVTSFYRIFRNAPAINQAVIGTWDVSTITNMEQAFTNATTFNQDLSDWDMSNVTTTLNMFSGANVFNQDITGWVVGNVTNMAHMFRNAVAFNQPIGNWNVSNVTLLNNMFEGAVAFNQDISAWNVSSVTNMASMFSGASVFNQDISTWSVNSVTNMSSMFDSASVFNQDISTWDVSSVITMRSMFQYASVFNQDISTWDVSSVTIMQNMFNSASNFNQNLGEWIIGNIESGTYEFNHDFYDYSLSMYGMFSGTNLSVANYDNTLIGWRDQPNTPRYIRFFAGSLNFCISENARGYLISNYKWIITDGGKSCFTTPSTYFISTWETTTANETITIPTTGEGYNYDIDWDNDGVFDDLGVTDNATHTYTTAGTHTVSIREDFPRIYFNNTGDKDKISTIEQWGAIAWQSMEASFYGCSNLVINANDTPNLSLVTSLNSAFRNASAMNQNLSEWNVSNITNMSFMFSGATVFNQNIGSWNVSSVTDMSSMFLDASAFNGNISNWNVRQVTSMATMFKDAASFNQDIGNWNISKVAIMERMFENATAFDQDLGNWDISSIGTSFIPYYSLANMFNGVTLSLSNYDSLLMGWNTLSGLETNIPSDLLFSGGNSKYCSGEAARTNLISTYRWGFTDSGIDCSTLG